ncbi:MAG: phosphate/phosphite/phosphonate ABC transporter substrate-binding protein [Phycisphaeraceae bacterium]
MLTRPAALGSVVLAIFAALILAAPEQEPADDPAELVFVFQKQKDPAQIKDHADKVAAYLSRELGMPVKTYVPTAYSASVQALVTQKADVAYVSSIPFLLARRDAGAQLLLAEVRTDTQGNLRTDYDSVFVVRADSPLQSMADLIKNAADLRMVFTSTTSTSGYVMAYRRLVNEGLLEPGQDPRQVFGSVHFGGSYTQALHQVLDGRGDVCAVSYYTVEGPGADVYLSAEQREQLRVLARTPGVPTHLICVRGGLSDAFKQRIKAALLKLSEDEPELLADVYGAKQFAEVDEDEHVAAAVEALQYLQVPIEELTK